MRQKWFKIVIISEQIGNNLIHFWCKITYYLFTTSIYKNVVEVWLIEQGNYHTIVNILLTK